MVLDATDTTFCILYKEIDPLFFHYRHKQKKTMSILAKGSNREASRGDASRNSIV